MTYRETTPETLYEETELRQIEERLDDRDRKPSRIETAREKFRKAKRVAHERRKAKAGRK